MFIAQIAMDRGEAVPAQHRFKAIGSVFWDEAQRRASLKLTGFPICIRSGSDSRPPNAFLANFRGSGEAPLISGDLKVCTGEYPVDGSFRKDWQWIGYIKTSQESTKATQYWGQILVIPVIRTMAPSEGEHAKHYVYAHVFEDEA